MKVDFNILPGDAKVWMYQCSRALTKDELDLLNSRSSAFLSEWESHGIPVQGSVDVIDDRFIRIAAFTDEPSMCGRAQDAQVRLAKELEQLLNLELTNRMLIAFEVENGIKISHVNEIDGLIEIGEIVPNTPFFNNLVTSKSDFESKWKIPVKDSWLERYF